MLALVKWLSRRSLRHLHAIGALLGWIAWLGSPTYRRRSDVNAAIAGVPRGVARAAVGEAGRMVGEIPWLWLGPPDKTRWVQWEGAQLIADALDAGNGLVLLTPHLGSFEVCAQAYADRFG